jgi:hypothetical protein
MAKKEPKKAKPKTKEPSKPSPSKELSDDQLEQVAGGAYDAFLKISGIQGETQYKEQKVFEAFTPINPLLQR